MQQQAIESNSGYAEIDGDERPLISPDTYDLAFVYYETIRLFGGRSEKLVLWFRIVSQCKYFETVLPRYYNVTSIKGKPSKYGDFKVGRNSSFLREYASLFDMPKRTDRIPMSVFNKYIFKGKVKIVTHGFNQQKIPKQLQYSVVSELLKVKEL